MEDLPYQLSVLLNLLMQVSVIFVFRQKVRLEIQEVKRAKNYATLFAVVVGIVIGGFGIILLERITQYFGAEAYIGHNAATVFSLTLLLNMLITVIFLSLGRVIVGWKKMKW